MGRAAEPAATRNPLQPSSSSPLSPPARAPTTAATGLRLLLGTSDLDQFFDAAWEREPRLRRIALDAPEALLDRPAFDFHLSSPGGVSVIDGHVARPAAARGTPADLAALYDAYGAGASLLQTGLQQRHEAIAALAADIERDLAELGVPLAEPLGANAYLTPPWSQGFGAHYDNHCAIVVQVAGSKTWSVYAPADPADTLPVEPCPAPLSADALGDPVLEATLAPGDVLYIPRGFPHLAWCRDDDSLHVTFSLRTLTWADAIAAACRGDARFRQSIGPTAFDEGNAAAKHFHELLRPALDDLPITEFLQSRSSASAAADRRARRGRLEAIAAARRIGPETSVELVPGVPCSAAETTTTAVLQFGDGAIELDRAMAPVLRFIADHTAFRIGDLPAIDRPYDAVELVSILVQRGLLRAKAADTQTAVVEPHAPQNGHGKLAPPAGQAARGLSSPRVLLRGAPPEVPGIEWVACAERLSAPDCDEIVAACREFPELPPTTVAEDRYPGRRQASMRQVSLTPRTEWIFDVLRDVAAESTRAYFGLELTAIIRRPQYVEYPAGHGRFMRHNDYSHDQAMTPRKLTVIIQLSEPDEYEGGRLRVFGTEIEDLPDARGSIVVLPSFVFHEVTPVERGVRRALVAWIAGPRLR